MAKQSELINFNLSEIADGAAQEKFSRELKEFLEKELEAEIKSKHVVVVA